MREISFKSGGVLHPIKNLYLRWRYGAGCCDVFDLYGYLARRILPALKEFRKSVASYPTEFETCEKWEEALDKMIWSFQYLVDGEPYNGDFEGTVKLAQKEQEGFELFGKHFRGLWK